MADDVDQARTSSSFKFKFQAAIDASVASVGQLFQIMQVNQD